jgi:hypothetical protein
MNNLYICVGIIIVVLVILYLHNVNNQSSVNHLNDYENFDGSINIVGVEDSPVRNTSSQNESQENLDLDKYVRRTDVEMAAREAALQFCPVPPDYDPSQYIKKTEMKNTVRCPPMPDLKDYVLKSSIPPVQKCPPCVCPKVKVEAGLCKKCPPPINNCPKCEPCPTPPVKVCPAIKLPVGKHECPAPQACPKPEPCPAVTRCPKQNCPECKYYGIKKVYEPRPHTHQSQEPNNVQEQSEVEPNTTTSELLTTQVVEQEQFAPAFEAEVKRNANNRCETPADMNSNEIIGSIFN